MAAHQNKLEHVRLIIPVVDLVHIPGLISNLADIRGSLRVDHLDVELVVPNNFAPTGATAEQLDALGTRIKEEVGRVQKFDAENVTPKA